MKVFRIAEQGRRGRADFVPVREAMKDAFQVLQKRYENQGSVTGLPTGLHEFDEMTAGLQPSDLIILAAQAGDGKDDPRAQHGRVRRAQDQEGGRGLLDGNVRLAAGASA